MTTATKSPRTPVNRIPTSVKQLGYRFIDKDPVLDMVIAQILKSGRSPEWIERETEKLGRKVSAAAVIGWLYGGTKRPQNYTIESVMLALGVRRDWYAISTGLKLEAPQNLTIPARAQLKAELQAVQDAQNQLSKVPVPKPQKFSWDRSDIVQTVRDLFSAGHTAPEIAFRISKAFNGPNRPSKVRAILTDEKMENKA